MPLYVFFPIHGDGVADTFASVELPDDQIAEARAQAILDQHLTAVSIDLWCDDRKVHTHRRAAPEGADGTEHR